MECFPRENTIGLNSQCFWEGRSERGRGWGAEGSVNEQLDRRAKPAVPATSEAEAGVSLEPIKFKSSLGERLKSHIGKG